MDIVAQKFEVGRSSTGAAALQNWITSNVANSVATKLTKTVSYQIEDLNYVLAIMSTSFSRSSVGAVTAASAVGSFEIKSHDFSPMVAWMNAQFSGFAAPAAPALSSVAGGTLTSQGTVSVKLTYITATGETVASTNATLAVADDHELVVTAPVAETGATGWNVYIGTVGSEKKQNSSALAFGTNYTQSVALNTGSAAAPSSSATSMAYLQAIELIPRAGFVDALVIVSN